MKKYVLRAIVEMGFITFLFYANLLMGEYNNSGGGKRNGLMWAIQDVFTSHNFFIALIASFIGHAVFGYMRKKI